VTTLAPSTARGRRTRDAVVRAAREVFERRGFDGTRMSDITDAAGVSHGTVYTYFTSKEEVLAQVCDDLAGEVFAAVRVPDDLRADPVARIHEGNRRYLRAYARNARMLEVVEQAATTNDRFRSLVDGLRAGFVEKAKASLRQFQDDGVADPALDPDIAGPALVGMVESFARRWHAQPQPLDADRVVDTLTTLWARAIGLPAASSPPDPPDPPDPPNHQPGGSA
jgi:AcrR family transcriptional regulator